MDDGLYDNDAALEVLDDLAYSIDLELTAEHFAVGLGLLAWLFPSALASEEVGEALEANDEFLEELPKNTREKIEAIAEDPEAFVQDRHSRSQELIALLGTYEDGPREDALLKIRGAKELPELIEELAEECRSRLDQASREWPELHILTGEIALLGPLLELRALGVTSAQSRVQRWRAAFEKAAAAPGKDRGEWDGYVAKVQQIFKILESAPPR